MGTKASMASGAERGAGMPPRAGGLEGVIAAETEISLVDGAAGALVYRGHGIEVLAGRASYEGVLALLVEGTLQRDVTVLRGALGRARERAFARLPSLGGALALGDGMEALRAAAAQLDGRFIDEGGLGAGPLGEAVALAGALAVFAGAWARARRGEASLAPDPEAPHAADYLRMLTGREPSPAAARGIDAYFTTVADHGLNASTFVARIVASTGSDAVSAVVAALGALKGPLHGGAPGPVLDMLDAIGTAERAGPWLEAELRVGRRIMGMGHRVYRVRDPRAAVLERATLALLAEAEGAARARLSLARVVEESAERLLRERYPQRGLRANVEFYTATLLEALGLPRALFTPTFAAARVAGWCAHVDEQRRTGRLIRPDSRYVGPPVEA